MRHWIMGRTAIDLYYGHLGRCIGRMALVGSEGKKSSCICMISELYHSNQRFSLKFRNCYVEVHWLYNCYELVLLSHLVCSTRALGLCMSHQVFYAGCLRSITRFLFLCLW